MFLDSLGVGRDGVTVEFDFACSREIDGRGLLDRTRSSGVEVIFARAEESNLVLGIAGRSSVENEKDVKSNFVRNRKNHSRKEKKKTHFEASNKALCGSVNANCNI